MPDVSPEKSFVEDGAVWGRLELSMTPGESTVYELRGNQSQVVGRASGCDLRVDLPHISGSHCTVRPSGTSEEGQYCAKIRDISSNGTVVNGVAIGKQKEADLREGDTITFTKLVGQITEFPCIVFHACDAPKPAAAAARRSKRGRTSSDGGAEADADALEGAGGAGGAEGAALAGDATVRMAGASVASAAVGTPFSDGRLDLAFKDLAYEREQVLRLQTELRSKDDALLAEQARSAQAQQAASAKEAALREELREAQCALL